MEGFLFYIPNGSITQKLSEVNDLPSTGSWVGFDIIYSITLTSAYTHQWVEMQTQTGGPDAKHGRWHLPIIPVTLPDMPHHWFVTGQKEN